VLLVGFAPTLSWSRSSAIFFATVSDFCRIGPAVAELAAVAHLRGYLNCCANPAVLFPIRSGILAVLAALPNPAAEHRASSALFLSNSRIL